MRARGARGAAAALGAAVVLLGLAMPPAGGSSRAAAPQTVTLDGHDGGRTFDGVGALSAGASSRLLRDYPEPERGQILDYLFKPGYGAALDILKVEIGGDTDSTSGSEASHMRAPGTVDCNRGYEWWLMKQAEQRNPDIELAALAWGAPGWFDGGYWSQDNIDYTLAWLGCAKRHGLRIDYLSGRNESGYDRDYYVALDRALGEHGLDTKIVASNEHRPPDYWAVARDMTDDPEFADAVDVLGEHDVCHWRTTYQHCDSSQAARALGKPLWNSEQSTEDYADWAAPLARAMNRNYIDARITANINWSLVSAFYGTFAAAGTGLLLADQPWSGSYDLGKGIWVDAHTTQFTEPGWQYLDGASGYLDGGASYVTLRSPDTDDYSVVAETTDATGPETVRFHPTGGLSDGTVHLWSTDLGSEDPDEQFVHTRDLIPAADGSYPVTLEPGHVYTLSTTTGQHKGAAAPAAGRDEQLPLPYHEDFEHAGANRLAPYLADANGAFETTRCGGGRGGTCYRQAVTQDPIRWHGHFQPPTTVVGDPRWWGDYRVSAETLLGDAGYVELLGRVEAQRHNVAGYHLRVTDDGGWRLYTEGVGGRQTTLASGRSDIDPGSWHRLALRFRGQRVTASVDGRRLGTVRDDHHRTGQVGLRASAWDQAQFDDLEVVPTAPRPRFVPDEQMTATASSAHTAPYQGQVFPASKAVDDRPESFWHSEFQPSREPLPQSITLDLGRVRSVHGLVYRPRIDGVANGRVTGYRVLVSRDNDTFEEVAAGGWADNIATKVAGWERPRRARYVRLVATEGRGGLAAVAEVDVATTPIRPGEQARLRDVPQDEMTATATSWHTGYEPANAVDTDGATFWHSEFAPRAPLPEAITLDLGAVYHTRALEYRPRGDNASGTITGYNVYTSADGTRFANVASGTWPDTTDPKTVRWHGGPPARYVRLEAVAAHNDVAAAAEVRVRYTGRSSARTTS